MLKESYPYYLASEPEYANTDLEVTNKYTGEVATKVAMADADTIDKAIAAAQQAQPAMAALAPYERQAVLEHCVKRFTERADELAKALCIEAGKPIKDAKGEVTRLIDTFKIAAEESVRINGETVNLEISARAKGYQGMTKKVPIGPCSFISPFNFPLNLAAHKVAPAIAAGCTFVLKPASRTPIGALIIGEVLAETDLPKGAFSILPCSRDGADLFTTDERLKLLSFTGSPDVGWALKAKAGKKPVVLELGGNAACVVDEDADIEDAIERVIVGAYYQSGQSCISVQRLLVHRNIYDEFKTRYVEKVKGLVSGDPSNEDTFIGPMISEGEAERLHSWIEEAKDKGAAVLCGGTRNGAMLDATVMENVPKDCDASAEEAFGPLSILVPFDDFDEALKEVNNSRYGLQAGVFTRDIYKAHQAWNELEVGGVVIGDVPSWRVDNMPYGGVKDSGLGREGIRYAIEDMSETRLMVIRTP
ncbi:aldehyde dehydrogenase family protein [Alteromonas mediterranea]|jgi:acyl-CoA reductase-like NAD-dependent aldehyde dehydrogenase|uniref:Aldehyde dehydrogenase n=2 Tax=Alteromonas mediterranea TaxID=314275 RepID=A0AAC8XMX3_9ALTE|nr:aldehyde dehydrogenase family protein [Alteromonas mediterranea]MBR9784838.1 aldehyde dehydrogenase family protein [Gammaproteobacteria bacterium]AFV87226.1 aldehyde dehydrogenase [Alteromonas mediterranea DE1]AGP87308.1 aldehyde dehydrogenase [Alteromonas mediterranea U4]AGP91444.1 aldehyde dehydrogenase [Alteromonas mediterranea U7]AGP99242.1 aldehyde dehydrogenase [Alteromonas mediterranea UM7]|tara:strand:- start:9448 stop:10875 length:1428 start_codon:yes stop_codon:yes gene_type:complete